MPSAPHNELFFPSFDARWSRRRNLYWIPDFQPHYLPELFDSAEISLRMQSYNEIANSQGVLLLSSNAALADFRRFYPNATVAPRVWSFCSSIEPGAADVCNKILSRFGLPEKFLYIANQFWRHKDHVTALEALRILLDRGMEIPLVCTGLQHDRRDPAYFEDLVKTLNRQGLQYQVRFLGVVPREEQIQVFRAAAAVLQPSRFEGWSTVIEDAKALGRPIIASDIAVHREQLSGVAGAHLFRTSDPVDLSQLIATIWPDLQRGPIPMSEKLAGEQRDTMRLDTAHQFVAIVDEAITHP
jgi:glycosyltransferase involved in cell wall biosynthesis